MPLGDAISKASTPSYRVSAGDKKTETLAVVGRLRRRTESADEGGDARSDGSDELDVACIYTADVIQRFAGALHYYIRLRTLQSTARACERPKLSFAMGTHVMRYSEFTCW